MSRVSCVDKPAILYTSLPRHPTRRIGEEEVGRSYVAECIRSWKRANFRVVSLNTAHDIRSLSELADDVEFRAVDGDRPLIGDFLEAIRDSGDPIAGMINADIFISHSPDLIASVVAHAADSLVIAERVNVDPDSLRPTGRGCKGFDGFVFSTAPLSRIGMDFDLRFGEPWWDY